MHRIQVVNLERDGAGPPRFVIALKNQSDLNPVSREYRSGTFTPVDREAKDILIEGNGRIQGLHGKGVGILIRNRVHSDESRHVKSSLAA